MRIKILSNGRWGVIAHWLGGERIVFQSRSIWKCIRFVREN